jgi:hypothetical protein
MPCLVKDSRGRSPFWTCSYTAPDGRRLKKSTKQTDKAKAWEVCLTYVNAEGAIATNSATEAQLRKVINDDNVIVKRTGNSIAEIITWKDRDTAHASGRFVRELRQMGYRPGTPSISVYGDATGVGKTMCDLIRQGGIGIIDFNFGSRSCEPGYRDEGTRIWYSVAKMIRDSKIMAPDRHSDATKKLCAQLTARRQKVHSSGKL